MSFPVNAFVRATAKSVPKGSLFYAGGGWWFRSELILPAGVRQNIHALTGPQTGQIGEAGDISGTTLGDGYSWEIRVKDYKDAALSDNQLAGTIVVKADGSIEIWGHLIGVPEHKHGFNLAGDLTEQAHLAEERPYFFYRDYEVWLIGQDGKPVGGRPLFEARAQ